MTYSEVTGDNARHAHAMASFCRPASNGAAVNDCVPQWGSDGARRRLSEMAKISYNAGFQLAALSLPPPVSV